MAEMDNYKKRAARDKEDAIKYGNEKLIKDILPILDSLDRALHQSSDLSVRNNFEAFQKGLELIHSQILGCLEKNGVRKIVSRGEEFDPDRHQALMQVETQDMENNRVVDEYESGYTLHGRLLRPSKVSVSKNVLKDDEGQ
jgi:molecular chaperone GrpE